MGKGASSLLVGVKVKALHLAFAHIDGTGSPVLLQCLAGLEQLLSRNVFLGCPFSGPSTRAFFGGFSLSVPVGVFQLSASSVPCLGFMKEKESLGHSPYSIRSPKVASRMVTNKA